MIKMDRPALDARIVFATCISRVKNLDLRQRLAAVTDDVVAASEEFDELAEHNRLHEVLRQTVDNGSVTTKEMEAVYNSRMAQKGAPGRDAYDELMNSAPSGRCPLCGQRVVSTLDHHLPKSEYPALVVAPLNLIPACADCNKAKRAHIPTNARENALHPYYDDIESDRWLYADVVQTNPAAVHFFVNPPVHWGNILAARVHLHFRTLGLGPLYAAEAADEIVNIRHQLQALHAAGGLPLVRTEMASRAESCRNAKLNGWRTAAYEALAASDWFCGGGFG